MTTQAHTKSAELDVVTFGEAMMMFVATQTGDLHRVEQFVRRAAGAELNVAIGLARLELKCGWVSRLGNDSFGRFIQDTLDKEHVDRRAVTIEVLPLVSSVAPQRHFIVLFVAEPPVSTPTPPQAGDAPQTDELESTRRHLESALEQLEASHAELTAANEALVASKQELRRLAEELQMAREDLSTTNEELRTVNDELNARNRPDPARTDDPVDPT